MISDLIIIFLGWPGKRSSQHSTLTGCTHPSTLHVWRVTLLSLSSLCKQSEDLHMIPQKKVHHSYKMLISLFNFFMVSIEWTVMFPTCKHVTFQVYIIEYYLFSNFRNYGNVLQAKLISNLLNYLKQWMLMLFWFHGALSPSNKLWWIEYALYRLIYLL